MVYLHCVFMFNMISQRTLLSWTKSSQILDFPFVQTSVVCKAGQKELSKRKLNYVKAVCFHCKESQAREEKTPWSFLWKIYLAIATKAFLELTDENVNNPWFLKTWGLVPVTSFMLLHQSSSRILVSIWFKCLAATYRCLQQVEQYWHAWTAMTFSQISI